MAGRRPLSEPGAGVRSPPPSSGLSCSAPAGASWAARSSRGRYPPTLTMVTEAVEALNEKKGSSTAAIKRYIRHNYPGVDPIRLKYYLRKALLKGLEKGYLVRPLNSSAHGATGRFKLAALKPKKGKTKRAQPAQGEGPRPKLEKEEAAEGKARAEDPKGKGAEGKQKAASKKAKAESNPVLAADPMMQKPKEKTAAEAKAPKKPRAPKALQVKVAKAPSKAAPKGEAKAAPKGEAKAAPKGEAKAAPKGEAPHPKAGAGEEAEPPAGERVKGAKGSQAKSQAGGPKTRAPKAPTAPKAGKKAAAKGKEKEKEAKGAAGPKNA